FALAKNCQPRSNAAPTLVVRKGGHTMTPLLGLGSAGSRRIISSILQVVSHVIDGNEEIADAVAAPRIHGFASRKVPVDRPASPTAPTATLRGRLGDPVLKSRHNCAMGSVQAIHFLSSGAVSGAADPRRDGTAAVLHY